MVARPAGPPAPGWARIVHGGWRDRIPLISENRRHAVKPPRFASLLAIPALAGSALATPDTGSYLVVSRDSEAILDLFSMPVVGIGIFVVVLIVGMIMGLQRSAHEAHMQQLERQRQALRGRRPVTGPAARSPATPPKHPVG
jgi:hypothetical protein